MVTVQFMVNINRRTLLTTGTIAGGAAATGFGVYELLHKTGPVDSSASSGNKPNVLLVIVDQMRAPQWFPDTSALGAILPNISRLQSVSTTFVSHYTASNMCTPSRGAMTTGLYSHQTGCLFSSDNHESTLAPQFPTWGTMLRQQGYRTWWWGKWHLGDWGDTNPEGLDKHGFWGGTFPSPNGMPNQGLQKDPGIVDQFSGWFDAEAGKGPWCTTVSLVNPHDICWWPMSPLPDDVPHWFDAPAANFETLDDLVGRRKPQLQIDYASFITPMMNASAASASPADLAHQWARQLDMYLWLQQQVDIQIGRILDKLASHPDIDRNTIVIFTSDHGEYGGSHGLVGKGAAAYDEAIKVPLYVRDPHGVLTPQPGQTRTQLTSSVDLVPLLLTVASGGNGWREDPRYSYLASRTDIAGIAAHNALGRKWIAHVTDDMTVEQLEVLLEDPKFRTMLGKSATASIPTAGPSHIVAVRTPQAKLATYSYWKPGTMHIDPSRPTEHEFYDYSTSGGRQESDNQSGRGADLENRLQALIDNEVLPEIHQPLPAFLCEAQEQGLADMHKMAAQRGG